MTSFEHLLLAVGKREAETSCGLKRSFQRRLLGKVGFLTQHKKEFQDRSYEAELEFIKRDFSIDLSTVINKIRGTQERIITHI